MTRQKVAVGLGLLWAASVGAAFWVGQGWIPAEVRIADRWVSPDGRETGLSTGLRSTGDTFSSIAYDDWDDTRMVGQSALNAFSRLRGAPGDSDFWDEAVFQANRLNPADIGVALEMLDEMPDSRRRSALMLDLLQRWGKSDPTAALAYAGNVESLRFRYQALEQVLSGWATQDPVAAMAWLDEHSGSESQRAFQRQFLAVVAGYAEKDPAGAFAYAANLPEDLGADRRMKNQALNRAVEALFAQGDLNAALGLVQGLPDGDMKNQALSHFVGEWARQDPEAALNWMGSLGDGVDQGSLRRSLMRSWADADPQSAATWLATQQETAGRDMGFLVTGLIARWSEYDTEASAQWLNQMPPSPEIDRAVAVYTARVAADDPEAAMSWAVSITNEGLKNRLMSRVAGEWKEADPTAFSQYLESADLDPALKEILQNARTSSGTGGRRGGWWGGF